MMRDYGTSATRDASPATQETNLLLLVGNRTIPLDQDGNLANLDDWSIEVASLLARELNIEMGPGHWEIVELVRDFYQQRGLSPIMRILVRLVERNLGPTKGNSLYLLSLFPGNPARAAARIAGLPRPVHCV